MSRDGAGIDWSISPILPRWLGRRVYVDAISQFLHAEHAALRACDLIATGLAPDDPARRFIIAQQEDERRHVALYARYLARLGETATSLDPALAWACEVVLSPATPTERLVLACHVLLEGEAVRLHGEITAQLPCPLLRAINTQIARDEARHAAFGRVWLRTQIAGWSEVKREETHRWAAALWEGVASTEAHSGTIGGRIFADRRRTVIGERWVRHKAILGRLGLDDA